MSSRDQKQLKALRLWLEEAAKVIQAEISIKLWNGEIIPMGPNAKTDVLIVVNSPEAVRRLMFSPKLMTAFDVYNDRLLDIEGGTPLQAMRRWHHMRVMKFVRNMNKVQLAKTLSSFLFKSKEKTFDSGLGYTKKVQDKLADGRDDMDIKFMTF